MDWLAIFKHLLPNAKAWRITLEKRLREFFEGLTVLGEDAKQFFDRIYLDIFPQTTRQLSDWEQQFALPNTGLTEQERRDRLDATWKALGGQSPQYIQDTLQANGFNVYVHEWWEPIPGRPGGGSIDNDVTPVARDPFDYLNDGATTFSYLMTDGAESAQDGDSMAQDGATSEPAGYPLVNKILESSSRLIGDGAEPMQDGRAAAQDGSFSYSSERQRKIYVLPTDPDTFPYYLYIGGETFPDQAQIPPSRRDEFEDLCLKICPTEQWLGILVTYT